MPCFDQPDLKARWTARAQPAAGWAAVSNGARVGAHRQARPASASCSRKRSRSRRICSRSRRASSASRPPSATGRTFRMFHRETDAAKVARNRDAIFDLHANALAWLEDYTGIPYPFGKFDFVADPVVPVRRHGAPGRDLLQRERPAARRVARRRISMLGRASVDLARDVAHVVRRSRDDEMVQRRVDEGGVREFHGREDREPVVSRR